MLIYIYINGLNYLLIIGLLKAYNKIYANHYINVKKSRK